MATLSLTLTLTKATGLRWPESLVGSMLVGRAGGHRKMSNSDPAERRSWYLAEKVRVRVRVSQA